MNKTIILNSFFSGVEHMKESDIIQIGLLNEIYNKTKKEINT